MKKFFKTRLFTIVLTMLICVVVFGIGAFAGGITKSVPATATVVAGNPYIELYTDSTCATQITSIPLGEVGKGNTSVPVTYYIKNTGWVDFASVAVSSNINTSYGSIQSDINNFPLAAGEVKPIKLSLSIFPGCSVTNINFDYRFTGN